MKNTVLVIICLFLADTVFGQAEPEKMVTRDVLLVKRYIGSYSFQEKSSIKKIEEKGFRLAAEDNYHYIFLPYDIKWPLGTFLRELHARPFIYLFKDIFASEEVFPGLYHEFSKQKDMGPKFNVDELDESNDYYVRSGRTGAVAKFWVVEGEWEEHPLTEKPDYIKAITPRTLVFDTYNVLLLKKIISIRPIEKVETNEDSAHVTIKNDVELKMFKK